jgi:HK97 family phage major capsid protein
MELKEMIESLQRAFEQFKQANDQRIKQVESKGHSDPLLEEKVNKANADISRLEGEIKGAMTAMSRMNAGSVTADADVEKAKMVEARKKAFDKLVRKGENTLSPDEMKTLSTNNDANGGYLVTPEVEAGIIRNLANINAVRGLANVRTLSRSNELQQRRRTAGISATWVGEGQGKPAATNPTYGMLRIMAQETEVDVVATAQMLEDSDFDVEGFLSLEAAEAFANAEGDAFLNGTGAAKPRGILTYAAGTADGQVEQVVSGTAATIADATGQANGIIDLVHKVKAAYAKNGKFLVNRLTTGSVRKLKDNNKQYIWAPGIGDHPPTILGYEYVEDDNMPVEGANNLVAVFGDFQKGYKIVDKKGFVIVRDPFSSKPDVEFLFRRRVGGDVEIFEALKILKCSV